MAITQASEILEQIDPIQQIATLRERLDLLEQAIDTNNPSAEVLALFIGRSCQRLVSCFNKQ
jgi:hypothetical protein